MTALGNDLWSAAYTVDKLGPWSFTLQAWVDHFDTWCADLKKRLAAQPDPASFRPRETQPAVAGDSPRAHHRRTAPRPNRGPRQRGRREATKVHRRIAARTGRLNSALYQYPLTPQEEALAARYPDLSFASVAEKELRLWVDRERARFSSWYELFPRSTAPGQETSQAKDDRPARHGTFADVELLLPEIAAMGFDILYLPPIHPIGRAFRKGPNNSTTPGPDDVGSPWAIGSAEGGHKSIHPSLGTFAGFDHLARRHARQRHGAGPRHRLPVLARPPLGHRASRLVPAPSRWQHPVRRKSAQEVSGHRPAQLRDPRLARPVGRAALRLSVLDRPRRARLPRRQSPHQAPRLLGVVPRRPAPRRARRRSSSPRPSPARTSCTAWPSAASPSPTPTSPGAPKNPNSQAYFEEIARPPISDFFTPNLWPNTPDILHASLQTGGRAAFQQRLILATTLAASYGIYGPAFELGEHIPIRPAARSICTARSTRFAAGTAATPTPSPRSSPCSTRFAAPTPPCRATSRSTSTRSTTRRSSPTPSPRKPPPPLHPIAEMLILSGARNRSPRQPLAGAKQRCVEGPASLQPRPTPSSSSSTSTPTTSSPAGSTSTSSSSASPQRELRSRRPAHRQPLPVARPQQLRRPPPHRHRPHLPHHPHAASVADAQVAMHRLLPYSNVCFAALNTGMLRSAFDRSHRCGSAINLCLCSPKSRIPVRPQSSPPPDRYCPAAAGSAAP